MTTTMKNDIGGSRKAKIAALFAAGLDSDAVWSAMQHTYPETIQEDGLRSAICKTKNISIPVYDPKEREKLGWAIRQIKSLMHKEDKELSAVMSDVNENGGVKSPSEIKYINRSRFRTGIDAIDYVYGHTVYRWTENCSKGNYKKGDLMHYDLSSGKYIANDVTEAKIEHGLPSSFLSLWGGSPGVGKTRTAIALSKSLNKLGHKVLYYNGEASEMDFRIWLGTDVDDSRMRIVSDEIIRTKNAVAQIYEERPRLVIFDSLQMLAESKMGNEHLTTALSQFKVLKSDEDAGLPHILFISQLNKKGQLAGSRYVEHMVDFSATMDKIPDTKMSNGCFLFSNPQKNRGSISGREVELKHFEDGIRASDESFKSTDDYKILHIND